MYRSLTAEPDGIRATEKMQQLDINMEKKDLIRGVDMLKGRINAEIVVSKSKEYAKRTFDQENARNAFDEDLERKKK